MHLLQLLSTRWFDWRQLDFPFFDMKALVLASILCLLVSASAEAARSRTYDVVVYGGTASGVIAAVAAAREGARVALLEPGDHLGGMVSGGLGVADVGRQEVVGGYAREYFERAGQHYGVTVQWNLEPHVAEAIFQELVKEADVAVFYRHQLREHRGVRKHGTHINSITLENGGVFAAKVFVDASYEGDLMAQAGISYTWGRESRNSYGESLAGVRDRSKERFDVLLPAYDAHGRLSPEVSRAQRAPLGSADQKVEAYTFRLCMTQVPANQVPFPRPDRYEASRYALLAQMLAAMDTLKQAAASADLAKQLHKDDSRPSVTQPWSVWDLLKPAPIPNGKTDTNTQGPFSTDYIGGSDAYPNGDYKTRAEIWQAHVDYVQGYLYFLQNDPQVPRVLHDILASWGLCKDEFVDTDHWPNQLYIREGRRMIGEYVMRQQDVQTELTKPDVIGMGSYMIDSHSLQRIVNDSGVVENEGNLGEPTKPYQIPYRAILPRRTEATNLLVPVCVSASHVAYSTLRMEPVYMILGQAAGVAANLAVERGVAVQDVDTKALTSKLRSQGAVMEWKPKASTTEKNVNGDTPCHSQTGCAVLCGRMFSFLLVLCLTKMSSGLGPSIFLGTLPDSNSESISKRGSGHIRGCTS